MMSASNAMPSLSALAHEANHGLDICKKETTVEHHAGCSCDSKELAAGGLCTLGTQDITGLLRADHTSILPIGTKKLLVILAIVFSQMYRRV